MTKGSRARWRWHLALPRHALLRANRAVDIFEQPVWTLALGFKLKGRQCSWLYSPFNDVGLMASLRGKCFLDVLNRRLKLLVRQVLDQIAVLDLVLARNQQRQDLEIGGRLRLPHPRYSLLPMLPEVAQKRVGARPPLSHICHCRRRSERTPVAPSLAGPGALAKRWL